MGVEAGEDEDAFLLVLASNSSMALSDVDGDCRIHLTAE